MSVQQVPAFSTGDQSRVTRNPLDHADNHQTINHSDARQSAAKPQNIGHKNSRKIDGHIDGKFATRSPIPTWGNLPQQIYAFFGGEASIVACDNGQPHSPWKGRPAAIRGKWSKARELAIYSPINSQLYPLDIDGGTDTLNALIGAVPVLANTHRSWSDPANPDRCVLWLRSAVKIRDINRQGVIESKHDALQTYAGTHRKRGTTYQNNGLPIVQLDSIEASKLNGILDALDPKPVTQLPRPNKPLATGKNRDQQALSHDNYIIKLINELAAHPASGRHDAQLKIGRKVGQLLHRSTITQTQAIEDLLSAMISNGYVDGRTHTTQGTRRSIVSSVQFGMRTPRDLEDRDLPSQPAKASAGKSVHHGGQTTPKVENKPPMSKAGKSITLADRVPFLPKPVVEVIQQYAPRLKSLLRILTVLLDYVGQAATSEDIAERLEVTDRLVRKTLQPFSIDQQDLSKPEQLQPIRSNTPTLQLFRLTKIKNPYTGQLVNKYEFVGTYSDLINLALELIRPELIRRHCRQANIDPAFAEKSLISLAGVWSDDLPDLLSQALPADRRDQLQRVIDAVDAESGAIKADLIDRLNKGLKPAVVPHRKGQQYIIDTVIKANTGKRVSLRDLADQAGVSPYTIRRAVSGAGLAFEPQENRYWIDSAKALPSRVSQWVKGHGAFMGIEIVAVDGQLSTLPAAVVQHNPDQARSIVDKALDAGSTVQLVCNDIATLKAVDDITERGKAIRAQQAERGRVAAATRKRSKVVAIEDSLKAFADENWRNIQDILTGTLSEATSDQFMVAIEATSDIPLNPVAIAKIMQARKVLTDPWLYPYSDFWDDLRGPHQLQALAYAAKAGFTPSQVQQIMIKHNC